MNYHDILHDNMLNGEGLRVVLFVSGCMHFCDGCQNPQTHDPTSGIKFSREAFEEIYDQLTKPYIKGLTITGGDPLFPLNQDTILQLCKKIKDDFLNKDIWVYTGYRIEELPPRAREILKYIDVLVDGRFIKELKDVNLPYVGSSNQRIIKMKEISNDKI